MRERKTAKVYNGQGPPVSERLVSERFKERRRAILDKALDAFVEVDSTGLMTGWNAQAEVLLGWPRSEALGRQFSQLIVSPGHSEAYDKDLEHFFEPGTEPVRSGWLETTALHRDGHAFPIELAAIAGPQGEARRMAAFMRDVTGEKQIVTFSIWKPPSC